MYVPKVRERVEIDGGFGIFLVLSVDRETQRAGVVSLASMAFIEDDVSFAVIRPSVPGKYKGVLPLYGGREFNRECTARGAIPLRNSTQQ